MKISSPNSNSSINRIKTNSLKAEKAAQEFESIFTSMMIKSMRKTVFKDGLLPRSIGEDIYTDMLDQEYAKIISKNASFGLAEKIIEQIENKNTDSILKALHEIGRNPWMNDLRFVPQQKALPSFSTILEKIAQYDIIIDEASNEYGIDRNLIAAVIVQESAGNPLAQSPKGAKGLMQLIDSTAKEMGVSEVFDPRDNILGGTKYLKQLLTRFNGNETLALASYNAGPGAVDKYNGVPPYKETQQYVHRVRKIREKLTLPMKQKSENGPKD